MTQGAVGTLYGIGVGPGDPDLITVRGLRLLQAAQVIAFPAGSGDRPGLAQQIIAPWTRSHQRQLPLRFPYVQDPADLQAAWQEAADQVWAYLAQGQNVAFASEGDTSFYSTFSYLAQTLKARYPQARTKTIPGVCSPMAAAAVLDLPLTLRSQRLAVLPALYSLETLETVFTWADVVVLMKVSSVYASVWQVLQRHQLLARSYIVERATQPQQVLYADLSDRPQLELPYFALLIVQVRPDPTLAATFPVAEQS